MSERQETSYTMDQAMRTQRRRDKQDRKKLRRSWAVQPQVDLDAIAEAHGLRLHRVGQGLSICICRGQWQAARFWPATQTLVFDGGQQYPAASIEQAIQMVADVLKLD